MPTLATSDTGDAILARIAGRVDGESTTLRQLSEWLNSGHCPGDVARSAAWSTLELLSASHSDLDSRADDGGDGSGAVKIESAAVDPAAVNVLPFKEIALPDNPDTSVAITLDPDLDGVIIHYRSRMHSKVGRVTTIIESASSEIRCVDLLGVWNSLPETRRPRNGFPLEILYQAWLHRAPEVVPSERNTGRILPAGLAQVAPGDRRIGKLFTVAAHVVETATDSNAQLTFFDFDGAEGGQAVMPGFQDQRTVGPCLPLALYDLADTPSSSRGPAAPLPLRIFVEAVLAVPLESRDGHSPVAMEISLRQLVDALYPGPRRPRASEYWSRLMAAFEALESPAARVPWVDPKTGRGGMRRIVNITSVPRSARYLDDPIRIIVDLPPGSGIGPQVSDNLRYWGVKSAAAYRALLNLAYQWFEPGRTHFPTGRGRRQVWLRSYDPDHYPEFNHEALISLCFPSSANQSRRNLVVRAREVLHQLEDAGELRLLELSKSSLKILPPLVNQGEGLAAARASVDSEH